jgi:hypothetical protein
LPESPAWAVSSVGGEHWWFVKENGMSPGCNYANFEKQAVFDMVLGGINVDFPRDSRDLKGPITAAGKKALADYVRSRRKKRTLVDDS